MLFSRLAAGSRPPSNHKGLKEMNEEEFLWPVDKAEDAGIPGAQLNIVFAKGKVAGVEIDNERLKLNDPRLGWLRLRGLLQKNGLFQNGKGPFPPKFQYSPFDGTKLPDLPEPYGIARTSRSYGGDSLPVVRVLSGQNADIAITRDKLEVMFSGGQAYFFVAGPMATLFSLSEDGGVLEWHREESVKEGVATYKSEPLTQRLGRLQPLSHRFVAIGKRGFVLVANDNPIWMSNIIPFESDKAKKDAYAKTAWGPPALISDCFAVPVRESDKFGVALRGDKRDAKWTFVGIKDDSAPAANGGLGKAAVKSDFGVVVWPGAYGFLSFEYGADAEGAKWIDWPKGVIASAALPLYQDPQRRFWAVAKLQGGTNAKSNAIRYGLVSLTDVPEVQPIMGLHASGGTFTIQGTDYFDNPVSGTPGSPLRSAVGGRFCIPLLAGRKSAVIAAVGGPDDDTDAFLDGRAFSANSKAELFLLNRTDQSMEQLRATFDIRRYDDLSVFFHDDRLFVRDSANNRCYAWLCKVLS
jgi:hypothetical protein